MKFAPVSIGLASKSGPTAKSYKDLDVETNPEPAHRLRQGYIGLESYSYPFHFRNTEIRELAPKGKRQSLYTKPADLPANWQVEEGKAKWSPMGDTVRADRGRCKAFALELYVRASLHSNGGVLFRAEGSGGGKDHYEIQLHDVEGTVYSTGSLYGLKRAKHPHIPPETSSTRLAGFGIVRLRTWAGFLLFGRLCCGELPEIMP